MPTLPHYYAVEYYTNPASQEVYKFAKRSERDRFVQEVLGFNPAPRREAVRRNDLHKCERQSAKLMRCPD